MGSQRVSIDSEDFIVVKSTDIIGIVKWVQKRYLEQS
jgi:co-chaperonin GroES (HSP10)